MRWRKDTVISTPAAKQEKYVELRCPHVPKRRMTKRPVVVTPAARKLARIANSKWALDMWQDYLGTVKEKIPANTLQA